MVWSTIAKIGKPLGLLTYGTEAMGALRIEKGHVAGAEIDGRTTLRDLGLHGIASKDKPFVGSMLMSREFLVASTRPTLVGLRIAGNKGARAGALLFSGEWPVSGHGEGWVSSTTYSPALGCNIALGFLKSGGIRMGEAVRIVDHLGGDTFIAQVVSSHFYDPEGDRQNA